MAAVHATYYTEPACPRSWAAEPALRRLEVEFGEQLDFTYVMCPAARTFEHPQELALEWLDAAQHSGMPVDVRLWLAAPPGSSYPACMAVKAAAEQGLGGPFLRRAREAFAFQRRSPERPDALLELGRSVDGLNLERFRIDLESHAIVEEFGADLERGVVAGGGTRVRTPHLVIAGAGSGDPDDWRAAALAAGAVPTGERPGVEQALFRFGRLATPEVAAVCDLPGPRAAAELWRLASEWRVRAEPTVGGELWTA